MKIEVSINKSKKKITNKNITKATEDVLKTYKTKNFSNNNIKITSKKHSNSKTLQKKKRL